MSWILLTLGVAFCSAIVPLINAEVFLLGLCASQPGLHWLWLGAAVAAWVGSVTTPCLAQDRWWRATTWPSQHTVTSCGEAVTSTNRPIIRGSTE